MPRRSSPRSSRALHRVLLTAVAGPLLCGIGSDTAAQTAVPATHTVVMEGVSFQPAVLTIRLGDSVAWLNKDAFPHTATSGRFDSKVIAPAGAWTHTPTAPGEHAYVCIFHPTMKGTLRVQ